MILDFSEIPEEGLEMDYELRLVEPGSGAAEPLVRGAARFAGTAHKGRRGIELQARLEATLCLECSRCLEPYEQPLATEFFLVVVSEAAEFGLAEKRLDLDDATLFYADRGKVDLREVAREQVLLNLPLKPICRPACAGLCPTCGVNRNRIECACRTGGPDPRLAPLLEIKFGDDED